MATAPDPLAKGDLVDIDHLNDAIIEPITASGVMQIAQSGQLLYVDADGDLAVINPPSGISIPLLRGGAVPEWVEAGAGGGEGAPATLGWVSFYSRLVHGVPFGENTLLQDSSNNPVPIPAGKLWFAHIMRRDGQHRPSDTHAGFVPTDALRALPQASDGADSRRNQMFAIAQNLDINEIMGFARTGTNNLMYASYASFSSSRTVRFRLYEMTL